MLDSPTVNLTVQPTGTAAMATVQKVFIGYVQADTAFAETLINHLVNLEQQNLLEMWDESRLAAHDLSVLEQNLSECHTALLLVSRHFMNSPFMRQHDIPQLLRRRHAEDLRVVPIILSACNWGVLDFCKSQAMPKGFVPIDRALYPDKTWHNITQKIQSWSDTAQAEPAQDNALRVDIYHLPRPVTPFIGRHEYLSSLDRALESQDIDMFGMIASAGVGKSALVDAWLSQIAPMYMGVKRVFAWSFYQQGQQRPQTSSSLFFEYALPFFGHTSILPRDDVAKATRLVELLRKRPSILVLDGIEPLQYAPYSRQGELHDMGLKTLLNLIHQQGLGKQRLVVLTSRQNISELAEAGNYVRIVLENLNIGESVHLLNYLGVKQHQNSLMQLIKAYGGHALALVLLGHLLGNAYANIATDELQHLPKNHTQHIQDASDHALRLVEFYDQHIWSENAAPRDFMLLLSLFDRPMTQTEWQVLLQNSDITQTWLNLNHQDWWQIIAELRQLGLLLPNRSSSYEVYDTHPLIRQYFQQRFQTQDHAAWQQAHWVLFDHFQAVPSKSQPETLTELEPLYRAVYHGCLAGQYYKALETVYQQRIMRNNDYYSTRQLGLYAQDLTALAHFFNDNWQQPRAELSREEQSWLLAQVSFYLMSLGRLEESLQPQSAALALRKQQGDWKNVANSLINRTDLLLALGQFNNAEETVSEAITYAQRCGDDFVQMNAQAKLAVTLHCQGQLEHSLEAFHVAEVLQKQTQPEQPWLYSLAGAQYCNLLLDLAKGRKDREQILKRANDALIISREQLGLMSIAFDHMILGNVLMQMNRRSEAQSELEAAVANMRKANVLIFLPQALLSRARFRLQQQHYDLAEQDINEVKVLSQRCHMLRYQIDAELLYGHWLLDKKYRATPSVAGIEAPHLGVVALDNTLLAAVQKSYDFAAKHIKNLNYGQRKAELALLAARLAHYSQRPQEAYSHLNMAKTQVECINQWGLLHEWDVVSREVT